MRGPTSRERVLTAMTLVLGALLCGACLAPEPVPPSAAAPSAGTLAIADMLPTTLGGVELADEPAVDPTTGALSQLVLRLDRTSEDVEAAGRTARDDGAGGAFVIGVRIAGVDGERLLAEAVALISGILEREAQAVIAVDVLDIGDKRVTRMKSPVADEPLYFLSSQDAIFWIGSASGSEADELIRQIP